MSEHWFVRAGKGAKFIGHFREKKLVAIGFKKVGPIEDWGQLAAKFERAYPGDQSAGARNVWMAVVRKFESDLQVGDLVSSYDREKQVYLVGRIASEARWNAEHELARERSVSWLGEVPRAAMKQDSQNHLRASCTFFTVKPEVSTELQRAMRATS